MKHSKDYKMFSVTNNENAQIMLLKSDSVYYAERKNYY